MPREGDVPNKAVTPDLPYHISTTHLMTFLGSDWFLGPNLTQSVVQLNPPSLAPAQPLSQPRRWPIGHWKPSKMKGATSQ